MRRLVLLSAAVLSLATAGSVSEAATGCIPTRTDALGPFYEPNAPVRAKVGTGYVLSGRVRAIRTCRALVGARIELWLVNANGQYDDAHRATTFSRRGGSYRFESNKPIGYQGRPPHIHIRVSMRGFRTLVTQHYPRAGRTTAVFNLVLRRA